MKAQRRALAWDIRLAVRAAALTTIVLLLTGVVIVTTDEGAPFAQRLGMMAALSPLGAAVGVFATTQLAASRGELRALAAIGVDPARATRGAVLGGILLAAIGPMFAVFGLADLTGLFPRPLRPRLWTVEDGVLIERTMGLRVGPEGSLELLASYSPLRTPSAILGPITIFTLVALFIAAIACPLWAAMLGRPLSSFGSPPSRRAIAGVFALLAAIVAFQAVAARRLSPASLLAAPLILLIDGARARYGAHRR